MKRNDFHKHMENCIREMVDKQKEVIQRYGIGTGGEYLFTGKGDGLQFKKDGKVIAEFSVIPIGTWSGRSNSWQWAWSNVSIDENARMKAEKLKELTNITGYEIFTEKSPFLCKGEHFSHELVAVSLNHLDALGYYRVPYPEIDLYVYYALMEVKHLRREFIMEPNSKEVNPVEDGSFEVIEKIESYYGEGNNDNSDTLTYHRQPTNSNVSFEEQKEIINKKIAELNLDIIDDMNDY